MYTQRLSEALALVSGIKPDAHGTGTQTSDAIDMKMHNRVMFIVEAGTLATNCTLDFDVRASTTSGGTYTSMAGKSITQLTEAGTDSDKYAIVEVTAEEVAAHAAGARYIKGYLILGTAGADASVVALADTSRYSPASVYDLSKVDEIVA